MILKHACEHCQRVTRVPAATLALYDAERGLTDGRRKPRLADLYCCAGGAGMGYARAGFEVVGFDIANQPNYPFEFAQGDVLALDPAVLAREFDAIHASPICQGLTRMRAPGRKEHPNLIPATLKLLRATGLPWIIENVEGAEAFMPGAITLCGSMFPELQYDGAWLKRHRLFKASFPISPPCECRHDKARPVGGVYGGHARRRSARHGGRGTADAWPGGHRAAMSALMGMDWGTADELSEAIPPAYTEWLGAQMLAEVGRMKADG